MLIPHWCNNLPNDQRVASAWSRIIQSLLWAWFLPCPASFARWCQRSKRTPRPCIWGFPCHYCDGSTARVQVMVTFLVSHWEGWDAAHRLFWMLPLLPHMQLNFARLLLAVPYSFREATPQAQLPSTSPHRVLTGNFRERGNQGGEVFGGKLSVWIGLLLLLHRSAAEPLWRDCCPPIYCTPLI